MTEKQITVIGAGLVGSLLGICLQSRGFQVSIYERYEDIRSIPSGGRSINLVLTSRGLRAINMMGNNLLEAVLAICEPVSGRIMHQDDGKIQYQPYGKDKSEVNFSISRFELNKLLINKAEQAGCKMYFGHRIQKIDFKTGVMKLEVGGKPDKPGVIKSVKVGRLIGADGGGSAVRYAMRDNKMLKFNESMLSHGYKEMQFPAASCSSMAKEGLHIWPRGTHFVMGLANLDGSFTGTIYLANEGPGSFKELVTKEKVKEFFEKHYSDAIPLLGGMENLAKEFLANPVGILGTVRADKYNFQDKVLIVGDSAHAIVPFFGQGTNCGFEDCFVFTKLWDEHKDWTKVFEEFDKDRRENGNAIADMALDNFVEMMDTVGQEKFLLQKAIENVIENKWPTRYRSRYAMVCYGGLGNVTYSAAQQLGAINYQILGELLKETKTVEDLDLNRASQLIDKHLLPLQQKLKIDLSTVSRNLDVPRAKL